MKVIKLLNLFNIEKYGNIKLMSLVSNIAIGANNDE